MTINSGQCLGLMLGPVEHFILCMHNKNDNRGRVRGATKMNLITMYIRYNFFSGPYIAAI